jgi:hypothetical protein
MQNYLFRNQLWYDENSGLFYWLVNKRGSVRAMDVAGSLNSHGYVRIKIDQEVFLAHRLAWFVVQGVWPELEIDHVDGDPLNNRISNLRECTRSQNCKNVRSLGASYDPERRKWMARICVDYKHKNLGRYDTRAEAVAVAKAARDHYFGGFSRAG